VPGLWFPGPVWHPSQSLAALCHRCGNMPTRRSAILAGFHRGHGSVRPVEPESADLAEVLTAGAGPQSHRHGPLPRALGAFGGLVDCRSDGRKPATTANPGSAVADFAGPSILRTVCDSHAPSLLFRLRCLRSSVAHPRLVPSRCVLDCGGSLAGGLAAG